MAKPNTIQQGESFQFVFDRDDEDVTGWTCTIYVKRYPDDVASITRVIALTDSVWSGFLTEAETAALPVSQQMLIAKLENATTNEEEQKVIKFYVVKAWV
jgi:hypothetical protein